MKWFDYPRAALQWLILLPVQIITILLGLVIVPIALPFRHTDESTAQPFTQNPGTWKLVTLPRWAWLWSNDRDGAMGDTRGWWDANANFSGGAGAWLNMFWWLAIRNPANNLRFTSLMSVNMAAEGMTLSYVGDAFVRDRIGGSGWQFVVSKLGWRRWYGLYIVREYAEKPGTAFVVRIGFKAEPDDVEKDWSGDLQKANIGLTYRVLPWKDIS